jgi:hypothetical protein
METAHDDKPSSPFRSTFSSSIERPFYDDTKMLQIPGVRLGAIKSGELSFRQSAGACLPLSLPGRERVPRQGRVRTVHPSGAERRKLFRPSIGRRMRRPYRRVCLEARHHAPDAPSSGLRPPSPPRRGRRGGRRQTSAGLPGRSTPAWKAWPYEIRHF